MKVLVVFIFSLLYSFMAHSACNETSCTTQIKRLYLTSNSAADIYIEPADNANDIVDCTLASDKFITLKKSHGLHAEIYSMLLAASIAGKEITLRIKDKSVGCELAYAWMYKQ